MLSFIDRYFLDHIATPYNVGYLEFMTILCPIAGFITDLMVRISVYRAFDFWETACKLVIMRIFKKLLLNRQELRAKMRELLI